MDKKTNLNNTQRKMLDEVYMEAFDGVSHNILEKRTEGYTKLSDKIIKEESKRAIVKETIQSYNLIVKKIKKCEEYLGKNGLTLNGVPYNLNNSLTVESQYSCDGKHPKLKKYQAETDKIKAKLARNKREVRARIYGMDTTYEAVEKEIAKYIAEMK